MKTNCKRTIAVLSVALALTLSSCTVSTEYGRDEVTGPSNAADGQSSGNNSEQDGKTDESSEAVIEETVLLDESDIKITAKKLEYGFMGPDLKLLIENNTAENLTFQCRSASVNGYMMDTLMSADVASGKKANEEITFLQSDLDICGIETIADMEITFHIFDEDLNTYLDSAPILLKTSAADGYDYAFDSNGSVAYDSNGIKIVIRGLSHKVSLLGKEIVVYIENMSEKNITVQTRDLGVNGYMTDDLFSCDVSAGKHAVDTITLLESDLTKNDIETIDNIELSFHIFDSDTWDTVADSDSVTVTF